jgi:hypothetical protein
MGLWLVTRYDDVRWALGEPRLSSTMPVPVVRRLPIAIGRHIGTLSPEELARTRSAGAGLRGFVDTVVSRHSASDQVGCGCAIARR